MTEYGIGLYPAARKVHNALMKEYMVDTKEKLQDLCKELSNASVIALDTEFLREKTYYAQLCLLQLATEDRIVCVDPLAVEDIKPLLAVLYDPARTLVLHSARQDLELFFDILGHLPENVFDTQIAATLLGYGDQIGYANLVKKMADVSLDKAHTRTDWSQRPLAEAQIQYAIDDVRYLIDIYHQQVEKLEERGRSNWLQCDFDNLADKHTYEMPEQHLWQRVKGAKYLKGVQVCVLQALALWREQRARQKNRPRRWIIKDDLLVELAKRCPKTNQELERLRGIDNGLLRLADVMLDIIESALNTPEAEWPAQPTYTKMTLQQEAKVDALMAMVKVSAEANHLTANVLASRKEVEQLLQGRSDLAVLSGWRYELVGKVLQEFLTGDQEMCVRDGNLTIVPVSNNT